MEATDEVSLTLQPSGERTPVKELRLALVCYGGVSLAIYMHGITKEIHKLVAASRGLERSPDADPFDGQGTESVYWRVLKDLDERQGVRTRVVVDIVSGTSAGGINGVFLAKALASNLSQEALRDIWMARGDLRELIPYRVPTLALKAAAWAIASVFRRPPRPPLDGDRMLLWLYQALQRMDARKDPVSLPEETSLVPTPEQLELFVTATDLTGYTRWVWSYSPKQVPDLWHRHVFRFQTGERDGTFGKDSNAILAFAARATSCFPGAFAPVSPADVGRVLHPTGWPGAFAEDFASIYELSGANVMHTYFIDGGVLDNFPFGHAIAAISRKPASTEVDRRLLYVEPDPMVPTVVTPDGTARDDLVEPSVPGMVKTIWSGLSTIPRHEPILTDLQLVRERNERIDQIEDIVATAYGEVAERVNEQLAREGGDSAYGTVNQAITEKAAEEAGISHVTYVRVKLLSIAARMADLAARICRFPKDSNHAAFVREVIERWARLEGYLELEKEPTEKQLAFVRGFDLQYRERRIRFVIRRINDLYARSADIGGIAGRPNRADLDKAKSAMWGHIVELEGIVDAIAPDATGDAGSIATDVVAIFDRDRLGRILSDPDAETLDEPVRAFTEQQRDALNAVRDKLGAYLGDRLKTFGETVYRSFYDQVDGWDERVRSDMLVRYLGFPYWDRLIYPLQYVSDITELNKVEVIRVSPSDVKALGRCTAKVKLRGVEKGHFGAFFKRDYRENDYLWGRLDGAERLLWMLFDATSGSEGEDAGEVYAQAFRRILEDERPHLTLARDVIDDVARVLDGEIDRFPGCSPSSAG